MKVSCAYCRKPIRRGWKYAETHTCFCSRLCHTRYMNTQQEAQEIYDEQYRLSVSTLRENELERTGYGANDYD